MSANMLRDALFLARMDFRLMFRSKVTWLWAFVMPVFFFYFIGTVTGGARRPAEKPAVGVLAPADAGFLAEQLVRRLEERDYRVVRVKSEDQLAGFQRRLRLPVGFTGSVLKGQAVKVNLERSSGGLDADYDRIRVGRAVYSVLADLVVVSKEGGEPKPERFTELAARPRNVTVSVESAGVRNNPPGGFQQSVPGSLVMFIMLVMFTSGSVTLTMERNQGILRRLASAPMARGAVVAGKWGSRMALGAIQVGFAMLTGTLLFRVDWGPHLGAVVAVLLGYSALAAVAGLLLGNFSRVEGQAIGVGVLSTNLMAALGGCWWPIEITPAWTQKLALAFPTGWAMDALHKLMSFGSDPQAVLPHLAAFGVATAAAAWLLARHVRFQ
ncbi:MAG: ABC transporter permease [Acidobacteria bacterium]|nr:ABC transporter permease [Acidobacteriota bacterium]